MKKRLFTILIIALVLIGTPGRVQAISVSDMQLNGQNADAAALVNGNDDAAAISGLFGGGAFNFIAKDDPPGGVAGTGTYEGITFSLLATGTGTLMGDGRSGTWDLTWSGTVLPVTVDLVAVLKGGNSYAAFLFDNELLSVPGSNSPGDPWKITFVNSGGQYPELSHLSLYGRDGDPQVPVPEPATMLLFGIGIAGLAGIARRKIR